MKKLLSLIVVLAGALGATAATPKQNKYTNLYEKIPTEGGYVGYVGVEIVSPGSFGAGGFNAGITTSHGKMFTRNLYAGLGAGYIADFRNEKGIIPIFAEGRYFFASQYQRRIYPHIGLRAGAAIATEGGTGALVQACVGFRVPLSEKFALNIEVGPQFSSKYEREHADGAVTDTGKPFRVDGTHFAFFGRVNFEF